jgi:hypothetical protein
VKVKNTPNKMISNTNYIAKTTQPQLAVCSLTQVDLHLKTLEDKDD